MITGKVKNRIDSIWNTFWTSGVIIILLLGVFCCCKPKSTAERYKELTEKTQKQLRERKKVEKIVKDKLTKECQIGIATKIIEKTFGKDVSYNIEKTGCHLSYSETSCYGTSTAEGTLSGKIKGQEGEYEFKLSAYVKKDTPHGSYDKIEELIVFPQGTPYYAYHIVYDEEQDIQAENKRIKKNIEEKAKKAELNVIVDGITVEFVKYDSDNDNAWYYSKHQLTPEQIYKVVKQRFGKAIHFDYEFGDYAIYIADTKCIIFRNNTIYKIYGGSVHKI